MLCSEYQQVLCSKNVWKRYENVIYECSLEVIMGTLLLNVLQTLRKCQINVQLQHFRKNKNS